MVGQLLPPVVCLVPESEIGTIHRVVGAIGRRLEMSDRDREAMQLVAPFAVAGI